jgi:hypothetical protein
MDNKQRLTVAKTMLEQASHQLQLSSQFADAGDLDKARLHRNVASSLVRQVISSDRNSKRAR